MPPVSSSAAEPLGARLERAGARTSRECLLVAPFIKRLALQRILQYLRPNVPLTVITRWHVQEVASGVSDLSVLDLVEERGGQLLLHQQLHAKYFRFDDEVHVGSANLTHTALGYGPSPNVELLIKVRSQEYDLQAFETLLVESATPATHQLADLLREAAAAINSPTRPLEVAVSTGDADTSVIDFQRWIPSCRDPAAVPAILTQPQCDRFTAGIRQSAQLDIAALRLSGTSDYAARAVVAYAFLAAPIIQVVDQMLLTQRRFGEMTSFLQQALDLDRDAAKVSWQTLLRWFVYFWPARYQYSRPRRSELIRRVL